jgi:hypothetical protein
LFRRKPLLVMIRAPKSSSMVVVIETAWPLRSTTEIWLVPNSWLSEGVKRNSVFWNGGSPALARPMD